MIAYKGFHKDLTCRGYQFYLDKENVTEKANCVANGFHCAENPLDCLFYYPDWRNSVYYIVAAQGDLDEDGTDSKISCTHLTLKKELSMQELLVHGLAYMARYPRRNRGSCVQKEKGKSSNGFVVVRGKNPRSQGQMGDFLAMAQEFPDTQEIQEAALFEVDGVTYFPDVWYDVHGKQTEGEGR